MEARLAPELLNRRQPAWLPDSDGDAPLGAGWLPNVCAGADCLPKLPAAGALRPKALVRLAICPEDGIDRENWRQLAVEFEGLAAGWPWKECTPAAV